MSTHVSDRRDDAKLFQRRAGLSFALFVLIMLAIMGRFAELQILKADEYRNQSESNRIRTQALAPTRGLIFDRNGTLLADNRLAYRLEAIAERVPDVDAALAELGSLLAIETTEAERFRELIAQRPRFQSVALKERLSEAEVARFAAQRHRFPGFEVRPYQVRHYPQAKLFAHVVGYVGRIDEQEWERVDQERYRATTHIGKTGLERFYEDVLHGEVGSERVEINAEGRTLRVLEKEDSQAGSDLMLTIDARLQKAAYEALNGAAGAIVALDPRSGEVLALVSAPSFDPNLFVRGISHTGYGFLRHSAGRPLFNRALSGAYEPGSTLKPFVGLAGLELGVIEPRHTIFSRGVYTLPGQDAVYRDWKKGGHGRVGMVEALAQSVNAYFYDLAFKTGIDRLHDYLAHFGFGSTTGIDLWPEASGILPSTSWKQARFSEPWFPGETVIAGIGQGYVSVTPMQLAQATALLAARGTTFVPHLLLSERGGKLQTPKRQPREVPVTRMAHWDLVIEGMEAVVHGVRGTARAVASPEDGYRLAGKTGTAQVFSSRGDSEIDDPRLKTHALFIGFAPVQAPRLALAVVVEHGGGGASVGAPIAKQVVDNFFALENQSSPAPQWVSHR